MVPNNVLIIGPPGSGKIRLAQHISKDLDTGKISENSHSGLIYNCSLTTKYFSTEVNLLIEEYPEERTKPSEEGECLESLQQWSKAFHSEEYEELRDAIDGVIFTIDPSQTSAKTWGKMMEVHSEIKQSLDEGCFFAAIAAKTDKAECLEEFEDECIQHGIEFVYEGETGTNEFKEKLGKDRISEILETHEWSNVSSSGPEEYVRHKEDKIDQMTKGLLEDDDESIPLDQLVDKLRLERSKVSDMKPEDRETYVKLVIEELLDYI